jgi:uncharacterized protein (DUF1778 family)
VAEAERTEQIVFRVESSELDVIREAARVAGFDAEPISTWIRQAVLEQARILIDQSQQKRCAATLKDAGYEAALDEPSSSRGSCNCGLTQDPAGCCDASCVMRV